MSYILIETAAFTPNAALVAANSGADRLELCSGFAEGGLSPSVGTIELVRESVSISGTRLDSPTGWRFCIQ